MSHNALHAIFGNRTPEEQSEFLKEICIEGILNIRIYVAYKELFDILFGGNKVQEEIGIEIVFARHICRKF